LYTFPRNFVGGILIRQILLTVCCVNKHLQEVAGVHYYISSTGYVFMAWYLLKHRDRFTLTWNICMHLNSNTIFLCLFSVQQRCKMMREEQRIGGCVHLLIPLVSLLNQQQLSSIHLFNRMQTLRSCSAIQTWTCLLPTGLAALLNHMVCNMYLPIHQDFQGVYLHKGCTAFHFYTFLR